MRNNGVFNSPQNKLCSSLFSLYHFRILFQFEMEALKQNISSPAEEPNKKNENDCPKNE